MEIIINHDKTGSALKKNQLIHHINRFKRRKLHDHINRCKNIWQNSFQIKTLSRLETGETSSTWEKNLYKKSTAKIMLSGEKLEAFPLRSGRRQRCSILSILFNTFSSSSSYNKERNCTNIGKKKKQNCWFADDMIVYGEYAKQLIKLLELIRNYSKAVCQLLS